MLRLAIAPAALFLACAAAAQDDPAPRRGVPDALATRFPPARETALKAGGANAASEAAVAAGLKWLANQQKPGGHWEFDPADPLLKAKDRAAATGLALLPFLGVGQTHTSGGKYTKLITDALDFLRADVKPATGRFGEGDEPDLTGHAFATLALCEAYALTGDAALEAPAQAAVNAIIRAQTADGGWGGEPGTPGDLAVTGWQVQALYAARLGGKLTVPDVTVKKAVDFLDRVSSGSLKSVYGRTRPDGRPGTTLSAAGLLCRYRFDGWGPNNVGLAQGTIDLFGARKDDATDTITKTDRARAPRTLAQVKENPTTPDVEHYYYATQVVYYFGGPEWQEWNEGPKDAAGKRLGGMRDWLVTVQNKQGNTSGSWTPDAGTIGSRYGRVGTTALAVLILETPYRYRPHYRPGP